jgi:hypothetical protein
MPLVHLLAQAQVRQQQVASLIQEEVVGLQVTG